MQYYIQNVYNARKTYKKIRKMSTISDKSLIINEIKKYYNILSDAEFARYLGIKPQTLNSWRVRNTLDYDLVSAKCVDINMDWIIRGTGNMLKSKPKQYFSSQQLQEPPSTYTATQDNSALIQEIKSLSIENYLLKEKIKEMEKIQKKESAQYAILVEK